MSPPEKTEIDLPRRPPAMYQKWRHLLFAHWSYDPSVIQQTLPQGFTVDTYHGRAWVGIVPFFMRDIRPRLLPAVPGISNFLELNVRTYVIGPDGQPRVWFYSLDANQPLAVFVARNFFHLNYRLARMSAEVFLENGTTIVYRHHHPSTGDASREMIYRPTRDAPSQTAEPGTLDYFLLERYSFFALQENPQPEGRKYYIGRVHHEPYQYRPAEIEAGSLDFGPLISAGLPLPSAGANPDQPEHCVYVSGVVVKAWWLERV